MTDPNSLEYINVSVGFLDDHESVAVAQTASEGIARLEAIRFRAVAQLNRHRDGAAGVVPEVAFALSFMDIHAGAMVAAAEALTTRLPRTLDLMDRGLVSGFGAMKVAAATAWLSNENALAADALQERRLPEKNPEQIRRAASHVATTVDREGADKRCEHHREGRRLAVRQGETGVASIEIEDGPTEKVTAAYRRIDREARALKTGDEPRTLDPLRADVALDLLLGGQGGTSERTEVFLYMDLFTYLGLNDDPAEMAGHGHIPASLAGTSRPDRTPCCAASSPTHCRDRSPTSAGADTGPPRALTSSSGFVTANAEDPVGTVPRRPVISTIRCRGSSVAAPMPPTSSASADETTGSKTNPAGPTSSQPTAPSPSPPPPDTATTAHHRPYRTPHDRAPDRYAATVLMPSPENGNGGPHRHAGDVMFGVYPRLRWPNAVA
ncbi:DUF222 domain-containing protein [Amycolatopsis sp. cmx-11-32]|uniref:DUF222 domain-containing protein n=1 Tax=Amycolatopsis sp. cmx-11-32 TaxID=2785796 RepID=UPI0039E4EFEC